MNFAAALHALIPNSVVICGDEMEHTWLMFEGVHYDIFGERPGLKILYDNGMAHAATQDHMMEEMDKYSVITNGL